MSDRREALRGRFRARALDRLRQVGLALIEMEEGRGTAEIAQTVARELHTLKGDSRMLGFSRISELTHALEGVLASSRGADGIPSRGGCETVRRELEIIGKHLRGELGDEGTAENSLIEATTRVGGSPAPKVTAPVPPTAPPVPGVLAEQAAPLEPPRSQVTEPGKVVSEGGTGPSTKVSAASETPVPSGPTTTMTLKPSSSSQQVRAAEEKWVQVNAGRLDDLCERVFEFVADFRALSAHVSSIGRNANGNNGIHTLLRPVIEDFDRRGTQIEDLMGSAWALRLAPVEPMLQELVGHAREIALGQGKKVRIVVAAHGAEVERRILDELWEPLLHLVRNAVDHGIEHPGQRARKPTEATLSITAEPVGPAVLISVSDDGRGIDVAEVRSAAVARGLVTREAAASLSDRDVFEFLFVHGFSTKTQVSEVSGRGVGLDVVQRKIESLGGTVSLSSEHGAGTRFALTVPAAISRERSLVVDCGGTLYAIPSRNVVEVIARTKIDPEPVAGGLIVRYRDEAIPLRSTNAALQAPEADEPWVVVLDSGNRRYAFGVPVVVGERDLVRRPVDALVARTGNVAASATLDDGRLVLILAVAGLIRRSEGRRLPSSTPEAPGQKARRRRVLVVDDSPMARDLVAEILAGHDFDIRTAGDGSAALALLEQGAVDLVLSDVEMPVVDGFELLRRIREKWLHLPVVMLTTRGSVEDRRRAAQLGAHAYLIKSEFEESTLVDTVLRLTGGNR